MFVPRGHYKDSPQLQDYFKSVTWLGLFDFRIYEEMKSDDQIYAILLLLRFVRCFFEKWRNLDSIIGLFFGDSDSMNFEDLNLVVKHLEKSKSFDLSSLDTFTEENLKSVKQLILDHGFGQQNILGYPHLSAKETQIKVPRSFTFLGKRFSFDAWTFSKVVYDSIEHLRYIPSSLDICYAVLSNGLAGQITSQRMSKTKNNVQFRDGIEYQKNLYSIRESIDELPEEAWKSSVYNMWLKSLSSLSFVDQNFPSFMKTKAWAMSNIDTQLASWTQLRHDSTLYIKQSYTIMTMCSYPLVFIDPRIKFWEDMESMAFAVEKILSQLNLPKQANFFNNFGSVMQKIRTLAKKQATGIWWER
eukprot:TRINITY_DN4697_c0_g1_i1.p1 TRINITY_DN4697_c0_g1~~TRINITY_DN4697_c0_g1_i1.p1  ORF type:complete len:358 (-),score=61.26 TRINITY_DN4697_c0_g1_i1:418-1491(-)